MHRSCHIIFPLHVSAQSCVAPFVWRIVSHELHSGSHFKVKYHLEHHCEVIHPFFWAMQPMSTVYKKNKAGKLVPTELLTFPALCNVAGVRSQTRCGFSNCGMIKMRTYWVNGTCPCPMYVGNHLFTCAKLDPGRRECWAVSGVYSKELPSRAH